MTLEETTNKRNNPKLGELVHNCGGEMTVSRIFDDSTIESTHKTARWLKIVCHVVRWNGSLFAF